MNISTKQLQTIVGGAVAMECDFLEGSPRPQIKWFMNNANTSITEDRMANARLILEGGRYLFIRVLTAQQRNSSYHCEAVNTLLGTSLRSPTTYTLGGELQPNMLVIYYGDRIVTTALGEPMEVVVAASSRHDNEQGAHVILSCSGGILSGSGVMVSVNDDLVAVFHGLVGVESDRQVNITCSLVLQFTVVPVPRVTFSITVTRK
jgi:hypothetical protein